MSETLDLSNVVAVTIQTTQAGLAIPNINTAALFSSETPSPAFSSGYKVYTNAADVATDFGSNSKAYAIAVRFFAQNPNPLSTNGYLAIVPLEADEAVEDAIARVLNKVQFFGILVDQDFFGNAADFAAIATYVQTIDKLFFYSSKNAADYAPGGMLDLVRQASETHTRCLFNSELDGWLFAGAYAGKALSTDFNGTRTAKTMEYKQLATITPDPSIDQTQFLAAMTAGVDVYTSFGSVPGLGTSGANQFFDLVYGEFWLKFALQTAGFNYLATAAEKIPQTEDGMEGLKGVFRRVCGQAVRNGFAAPGTWNSSTIFGNPEDLRRSVADIGYYVYSLPVSLQSQEARDARQAPLVQIALKTAGAFHKVSVVVNVNL